jgi:hypothetical protein
MSESNGESHALSSLFSEERVERVSDAYGEVSSALGIARLDLNGIDRTITPESVIQRAVWRVEGLERVLDHLDAALVGTRRERPTQEQIDALNAGQPDPYEVSLMSSQSTYIVCPWCNRSVPVEDGRIRSHEQNRGDKLPECPVSGFTPRGAQDYSDEAIMHHVATGE